MENRPVCIYLWALANNFYSVVLHFPFVTHAESFGHKSSVASFAGPAWTLHFGGISLLQFHLKMLVLSRRNSNHCPMVVRFHQVDHSTMATCSMCHSNSSGSWTRLRNSSGGGWHRLSTGHLNTVPSSFKTRKQLSRSGGTLVIHDPWNIMGIDHVSLVTALFWTHECLHACFPRQSDPATPLAKCPEPLWVHGDHQDGAADPPVIQRWKASTTVLCWTASSTSTCKTIGMTKKWGDE